MDIDEYISEKRSSESKRDLEEAKKRLALEKRRLAEEERRMHELERYQEVPRRVPGQPMHPWMVWNFLILFLVILGFVINLAVALLHEHATTATVEEKTNSLSEVTGAAVVNTTAVKPTTVAAPVQTATSQSALDLEPVPDFGVFLLYNEQLPAQPSSSKADLLPQGGIIINGTDTLYYNVVVRNKEKDNVRCDADKTTTINEGKDVDSKYYSGLKLDPFEKEELPNSVTGVGDIKVDWAFECRFEGHLKTEKKRTWFSLTLEG